MTDELQPKSFEKRFDMNGFFNEFEAQQQEDKGILQKEVLYETMAGIFQNELPKEQKKLVAKQTPTRERTKQQDAAFELANELAQEGLRDKTTPFSLMELSDLLRDIQYNNPQCDEMFGLDQTSSLMEEALQLAIEHPEMDYESAYALATANRVYDATSKPLSLVNPDYFLIYALGPAPHMKDEINRIYDTNPEVYYSHYRRSRHVSDQYRYFYPTEQLMTIEKMAGIASYVRDTGDDESLKQLMNKGYKRLYRYISKNKVLRYRDIQTIWKNDRWRYENLDETMAFNRFTQVTIALITATGKETEGMFRFYHDFFEMTNSVGYWELSPTAMDEVGRPKSHILDKPGYIIKEEFRQLFFSDGHVMNGVNRVVDYERERIKATFTDPYAVSYLESVLQYSNPTSAKIRETQDVFAKFGFPPRFFDRTLSPDEWTYFFQTYDVPYSVRKYKEDATLEENREMLLEHLVPTLFLYVLARDFFDTRMKYLKGIDKSNATEMALMQEKEEAKQQALEKTLGESRSETAQLLERFAALTEKETTLQREVKRLEQDREKASEKESEAQARIQFLEDALAIQDTLDELDEETDTRILKGAHIIVLAGRIDWHKKIQAVHPDWEFVEAEQLLTRDLAFLDNPDALVFYNVSHTGHSAYHRVKAAMNKYNLPLYPIGEARNIDLTLKGMTRAVTRFSQQSKNEEANA